MKSKVKKIISFICMLTIIITMSSSSLAKANTGKKDLKTSEKYYEVISKYTNVSVDELKKIEAKYGDLEELYGIYIEKDKLNDINNVSPTSVDPNDGVVPMTQTQYDNLMKNIKDGDILVTKDSWTINIVNHGHCCIVDDVYSMYSVYVVEAFGPNTQSNRYQLGNEHDHWRNYNRVRVYYPTNTTSTTRNNAATYAYNNLQDWDYDPFADVDSTNYLNCATLVWKAYESENVDLQSSLFFLDTYVWWFTVYPNDFVQDSGNTRRYYVNWSGDAHTW